MHDAEIGQPVWLTPKTKTACGFVHQRLAASIVEYDWPLVIVEIEVQGKPQHITVNRLDINLRPPSAQTKKTGEGDGANRAETATRVKPAFRPHKPLASGWEEPMLF